MAIQMNNLKKNWMMSKMILPLEFNWPNKNLQWQKQSLTKEINNKLRPTQIKRKRRKEMMENLILNDEQYS